ncbi:MAG: hypothetical protein IJC71_05020, partial [Clostridia bacterium]|nr:hypothetical protein [Clostridia bacterium]
MGKQHSILEYTSILYGDLRQIARAHGEFCVSSSIGLSDIVNLKLLHWGQVKKYPKSGRGG